MSTEKENGRAEFCRARFTKYPRWTDEHGTSRALTDHPNFSVCRNFANSEKRWIALAQVDGIEYTPIIVNRWLDSISDFVYELTAEIGFKGQYQRIGRCDPARLMGPGNVRWQAAPYPNTTRGRTAKAYHDALVADLEARVEAAWEPAELDWITETGLPELRHDGSCETSWVDVDECYCTSAIRELFPLD